MNGTTSVLGIDFFLFTGRLGRPTALTTATTVVVALKDALLDGSQEIVFV